MSLAVAICTRGRPEMLEHLLAALPGAAPGAEVVVVNQDADTAVDICRRLGLEATVVLDRGTGHTRARNLALRVATSDVVLFTDDDCVPPPGWAAAHLAAHAANPRLALAFGPVEGLTRLPGGTDPEDRLAERVADAASRPWLAGHGANMSLRRDAVLRLGGFDERLGAGRRWVADDHELVIRVARAGLEVWRGVGPPVAHSEWRGADQRRRAFRGYERGYGVLVGRHLRGRRGTGFVRARAGYLRRRVRDDLVLRREPLEAGLALLNFGAGVVRGLAMPEWIAGRDATGEAPLIVRVGGGQSGRPGGGLAGT